MKLHEAINIFEENLDDIIVAISSNMQDKILEIDTQKQEVLSLLTTDREKEIAEAVYKITVHNETEEIARALKALVRHKNAKNMPHSPTRITDADIDRAKQPPIQDLYAGKLRKQGAKLWGCCPFHSESTPSFVIDTKRNNWRCFGACGTGGDSIAFYAKMHNLDMRKDFIKIIKALI